VSFGIPQMTPIVRKLIITCVSIWVIQFLLVRMANVHLSQYFGVSAEDVVRGRLWQPFTYMFLHSPGSIFHVALNMLFLWMFGTELERFWRGKAFLRYFLVCGVGGGVAATLLGLVSEGRTVTIGASGAVFGLLIAYGVVFAERTILFMLIFPMKAKTMALIMFVILFFNTFGQSSDNISHIAHLGGAITGFLYLKRAWRIGSVYRDLKWKYQRKRFKVMKSQGDDDRWVN
jgi:membrane associated rhomboid family serine protease